MASDEQELGERAAKAIKNENASAASRKAVISGRVIARDFRQRPADRAARAAARKGRK